MPELHTELDRHLPFEQVFNFRDLGGYATGDGHTVKWRTVFRADGIHRLTVEDLASLDVRTVLDLRTPEELERGRCEHDSIGFHHLPILQTPWTQLEFEGELDAVTFLADRYVEMLDEGCESIARALHILGEDSSLPLVFHCAAGKDRTGVVAAVLLGILGVEDDDIAADYSLSRLGMTRFREWIIENFPDAADAMSKQPDAFLAAPAEAMHLFLERVRTTFGSFDAYVGGLGVEDATLDAVRSNLLT
ncbi:MAG TPA: tyrosine-protein phosphatase [Jatrophihabitantaceae bacterium]|nr:tyrosine-protein phosphatase [Jatrophihabitantaceae bacterium]